MASSIFQQLNNNYNSGNLFPNPQYLVNQFNEFKNSLQDDPQQMVQQLLQSGRMSQSQYNQLRQMASQFQQILNRN